jgi:hypothetical protein
VSKWVSCSAVAYYQAVMLFMFISGFLAAGTALAQTQLGEDVNGEAAEDGSGFSVSLSTNGNRVAIGAPWNNGNGELSGHVRVYTISGTGWLQLGNDIDGESADDRSGSAVSLNADGSRLAIGAARNDGNGENSGHVRVYTWSNNRWLQLGNDIIGEAAGDHSGGSVSLNADGNRLAIGAQGNDGNGENSGHVRIYRWSGTGWLQLGDDIEGRVTGDYFGESVSFSASGDRLAIGSRDDGYPDTSLGQVRVYEWSGATWQQLGEDIDREEAEDYSGRSVSLNADGTRLAIGAPYNDGNGEKSGHVRVYTWSNNSWLQLGNDIDGEAAYDRSGWSVSLSADGNRLAIGARTNDGNGEFSGHVRVYAWSSDAWQQLGEDIDGQAAEDLFGYSASFSGNGDRLAIGATQPNDFPGYVQVYEIPSEGTVDLGGEVQTTDGTGVCAMVLASGQYMFSCNPDGPYALKNLPPEIVGTVKRQVYAHGFFPRVDVLPATTYETVVMESARNCPDYNLPYNPDNFPDSAGKRHSISGRVLLQSTDMPICAMVLANGAYIFSCDGSGRYSLEFPLDNNGQFKLQVYADGFAPSVQSFDEFSLGGDVRMARSSECQ